VRDGNWVSEAESQLIRMTGLRILSISMLSGFALLLGGCNQIEQAHDIEGKPSASDRLKMLEEEVFELYSLAPCVRSHEYCSFPFLIEKVDALIAAHCLEAFPQEALRVYAIFEHFENPSPKPPQCL
jgi:hypothetical protein